MEKIPKISREGYEKIETQQEKAEFIDTAHEEALEHDVAFESGRDRVREEEYHHAFEHGYSKGQGDEMDKLLSKSELIKDFRYFDKMHIPFGPELMEQLKTYDTAMNALEQASGRSVSIPEWEKEDLSSIPWEPPQPVLDVFFLENINGLSTTKVLDVLVEKMNEFGYRPLTLAEFMGVTIANPDLIERAENPSHATYHEATKGDEKYVIAVTPHDGYLNLRYLASHVFVPDDDEDEFWGGSVQYLFVRK